jgi:hypothetical protein
MKKLNPKTKKGIIKAIVLLLLAGLVAGGIYFSVCRKMYNDCKRCAKNFHYQYPKQEGRSSGDIPNHIWAFWDSDSPPEFVANLLKSWQKYYPDYNLTLVTKQNMKDFISVNIPDNFDDLLPAFQADWVRLALLVEHGGFYMDSSIIVTNRDALFNVKRKVEQDKTDGFAFEGNFYTTIPEYPVIENWFIASIPKGDFVTGWFNEMDMTISCFGNEGGFYVEYLREKYGEKAFKKLAQNIGLLYYLKVDIAAQKVAQIDKIRMLSSLPATAEGYGPFNALVRVKNDEEFAEYVLDDGHRGIGVTTLIKLCGNQRKAVIKKIKSQHPIGKESLYQKYVLDVISK